MTGFAFFAVLLQAVLLSHSGWASVAIVRSAVVEQHGLLSDDTLTAFLALSQVTPGPLGFYLIFVGYAVRGWIGAVMAWLALIAPSFLIVPIANALERRAHVRWLRGATTGIIIGSASLMLATAFALRNTTVNSTKTAVIASASLVLLFSGRVASLTVVVMAGLVAALWP